MEIIREVRTFNQKGYSCNRKVGKCACGREVILYGFTNTCECGADYNMSGQLLGPRSYWGEETGESLDDILSIP